MLYLPYLFKWYKKEPHAKQTQETDTPKQTQKRFTKKVYQKGLPKRLKDFAL
jgi:hypothetical protein